MEINPYNNSKPGSIPVTGIPSWEKEYSTMAKRKGQDDGFMKMIEQNKRTPAPKGGTLGFGTWEAAIGSPKKAPRRRG